jgi:hypothetical protein
MLSLSSKFQPVCSSTLLHSQRSCEIIDLLFPTSLILIHTKTGILQSTQVSCSIATYHLRFISLLLERNVFVFVGDAESEGDISWLPEIELEKRRRLREVIAYRV